MIDSEREYETIFILDPGLDESRVNEEVERASTLIRDQGGTVDEVERWGRRRLAYEIARKRDGVYTLLRYRAGGPAVKELERRLKLNESVLRTLTVVVDPRYKEMMKQLAAAAPAEGAEPAVENGETEERAGGRRGGGRFRDEDEDEAPRGRRRGPDAG